MNAVKYFSFREPSGLKKRIIVNHRQIVKQHRPTHAMQKDSLSCSMCYSGRQMSTDTE